MVVMGWVSTKVILNDEPITTDGLHGIYSEINRMKDLANASYIGFDGNGQIIYTLKPEPEDGEVVSIDRSHPSNVIHIEDYVISDILSTENMSDSAY